LAGGSFVVFPSTNLVFDGTRPFRQAEEEVGPITEYGRQKAEAERRLLAHGAGTSVVRFTKILGPHLGLFREWIKALKAGEVIHPFSDMVMAPVPLSFAIQVLGRLAAIRLPGIVQVSGDRDVTYEEAARYLARRLGASEHLIQPRRSMEAGLDPESLPSYTTLDMTRLRRDLGMEPPDVWSALDAIWGL
jgi:dTDP-4-dehydrorhamnose reductase